MIGHAVGMRPDPNAAAPDPNDEPRADMDPSELKQALGRTGRMLKTAGLPFELDEFDEQDDADAGDTGALPSDRASGEAGGPAL